MKRWSLGFALALFVSTAACSSDDDDGGGAGNAGTAGTAGSAGSGGGTGGASGASGAGGSAGSSTALAAPTIDTVAPMAGGLHVMWTNVQTDCDEIEGERKTATAEYAVVFKVPGYVDNKHDGTATEPTEYTFRVRCRKGSDYSPYSNEMSGTP